MTKYKVNCKVYHDDRLISNGNYDLGECDIEQFKKEGRDRANALGYTIIYNIEDYS